MPETAPGFRPRPELGQRGANTCQRASWRTFLSDPLRPPPFRNHCVLTVHQRFEKQEGEGVLPTASSATTRRSQGKTSTKSDSRPNSGESQRPIARNNARTINLTTLERLRRNPSEHKTRAEGLPQRPPFELFNKTARKVAVNRRSRGGGVRGSMKRCRNAPHVELPL